MYVFSPMLVLLHDGFFATLIAGHFIFITQGLLSTTADDNSIKQFS